jgi:hypothetical protein
MVGICRRVILEDAVRLKKIEDNEFDAEMRSQEYREEKPNMQILQPCHLINDI